ncbi:MAG: Flp pilus assembly protein CpaB [Gemmataceae bacterium]
MKPKTMILMIVAVGCGLGASIMTSRLLAERRDKEAGEPTTPVLVTKARVSGWTEIKDPEKSFEVKQYPVSLAPKAPVGDLEKVKGKKLNKNVVEGYALTEADLLNKEQQSVADQLLPGQRATAVKVNAQSLAGGFVLPGARVDILLTSRSNNKGTSKTILQHVLVMAVDNQDTRNPETKTIIGNTVTVAATPQEAARLALAGSLGDLILQVKNPGDHARIAPIVVTEDDLNKPLSPTADRPEEVAKAETPLIPTITLPALAPEEKEEPKEQPKPVAEAPKVVAVAEEPKPAPRLRKHVMRIWSGDKLEKKPFMLGEKDPDDEDADADAAPAVTAPAKAGPKAK